MTAPEERVNTVLNELAVFGIISAIENAVNGNYRVKFYHNNGKIAIEAKALEFDKTVKSVILKVAKRLGIAKYTTIDFGDVEKRAILVDLKALEEFGYHLEGVGNGGSQYDSTRGHQQQQQPTTGGDPQ